MIKILLADDHAILRDGLSYLIAQDADFKVVGSVTNGREAVAAAAQLLPDVVIMDIAMLELNGIDATRQILSAHPNMKVVILSMLSSAEHVFRALRAGASAYVLKEAAGREIMEALRAVVAGKRYFCQEINETLIQDYLSVRGAAAVRSPFESLSEREREVLQYVVQGRSSSEIGSLLGLSSKTVETYRSRMMQKLGVSDLPALIKVALEYGLTV